MSRDYVRCCVVCLAERQGTREHEISLAVSKDMHPDRNPPVYASAVFVHLPLCARHQDIKIVSLPLYANSAQWIGPNQSNVTE